MRRCFREAPGQNRRWTQAWTWSSIAHTNLCTTRTRPRRDLSVTWPSQGPFPGSHRSARGPALRCRETILAVNNAGSRKLPRQFCRGLAIPNPLDVSERAARANDSRFSSCRVGHRPITILSVTRVPPWGAPRAAKRSRIGQVTRRVRKASGRHPPYSNLLEAKALYERSNRSGGQGRFDAFLCLPDTVDPRGPKGR